MSLEKLLDSVSDAVSAMVIFSNDAGSNSAVLRNLKAGAEGVRAAVSILADQARGTVALWNELGSVDCATRMNDACDGLMGSINDIVSACGDIQKDPLDNAAKANLLEAGKDVMKQMVAVLQFNDLYDVMVTLNKIVVAQSLIDQATDESWNAEDFAELIRSIVTCLDRRIESTHDIRAKQMLEESKTEMEKLGIGLATVYTRAQQDPKLKQKIPVIVTPLAQAVQKAIKAVKLTAKSPFDLRMLDTEFQYHDDEFIDEITVTASDFHASLNAVKKAVKSGDEFELERAIRAIEADLKAEIATAEEIAEETSDPILRAQMMAKIKQAKAEMGNMLQKLAENGKHSLLSGDLTEIEPLLEGASKMFGSLFESKAKTELIATGESLNALFGELLAALDGFDALEAMALTKDIAREIEHQGVYATSIADVVGDEYRKQRILGDYEQLKALCDEIPQLTTNSLDRVEGARVRLEGLISEARKLELDLLNAASTSTEAELMEGGMRITQALKALRPLMDYPHANRDVITSGLADLLNKMKAQTATATSWAATINDDPGLVARITGHAQQLRSAAAPLAISAKKCMATNGTGPEFEKAKREYLEAAEKFACLNDTLVASVVQSPDTELENLQGKLAMDIKQLQEAMAARDLNAMANAIAELKKDARGMSYLASLMSGDLDDPDLQRMLLDASNKLVGKLDGLLDASKNALKHPKDKDAMKQFNDILSDFESTVYALVNVTDSATPEDQMSTNAASIIKLGKKYAREVENDNSQAAATINAIKKKVEKQKQLAQIVAKRCDFEPKLASQVTTATLSLDDLLMVVEKHATEVKNKPADKKLVAALQKSNNEFCEQINLTGTLAQQVKIAKKESEERAKEDARLAEERAKQEAAEKQRVVVQAVPVGIKEVWMEAQNLVTLISESKLLEDQSPVGSLVSLADKLARAMQSLAGLSRNGTKNEIITAARTIAGMVDEIGKFIMEVSKNCRDPILNREMVDMGHVAKNFAVQLKIICSVKAGLLLEEDKDTAQSLIICAKGLCKAVGDVVNRAQVAKLKPITGNVNAKKVK